jgi:hypothetical protein
VLFTEVDAARATLPTALNLLASALRPEDGAGKWMEGMAWRSELCPTYQGFNPCAELNEAPEEGGDGLVYYVPVAYRVADECTTLSGRFDQNRVVRIANAVSSYVVAQELWTGSLTSLDPYDIPNGGPLGQVNAFLADGNATVLPAPAGADFMAALAELEDEVRQVTRGQQVFLHAPIHLVNPVAAQLRRVGNELRTATDGIVIADAGYPGTSAATSGASEVQTVTITGGPNAGTFTLTFDGQTTGNIPFNAAAAIVTTALVALSNLGPDDVAVTGPAGGPWVVTFAPELGNVVQMTGDGSLLGGGAAPAVAVVTTDPGHNPVAPTGDTWIYGTGPVTVRLGPVSTELEQRVIVSGADPGTGGVNRRRVWADRMFAVTFDPCAHFAMNVVDPPG